MEQVVVVVVLMVAAVVLVGVGERVRLPWPVLMVVLTAAAAFVPGLPTLHVDSELILPLFLPPLLWAVARRTSWSLFRARWRTVVGLAVALVAATAAVAAGTAWVLVPGISVAAAVALGAVVAPPDPVAVEAVAGPVRVPRRLIGVLQTEGLFNDAVALVTFQSAVAVAVSGTPTSVGEQAVRLAWALVVAVAVGFGAAWAASFLLRRAADPAAGAGLTLVVPFAVYLAAESAGGSGVVAVVIAALQLDRAAEDESSERLVGAAFWRVLELLITGVAFGLIGLRLREVVDDAGDQLVTTVLHGLVVAGVVVALRTAWMFATALVLRRSTDPDRAPRTGGEAVVLAWSGMRGLVTLALALSLPAEGFPARTEIVVIAVVVLLVTLVGQGLTLPLVVRLTGVEACADAENEAEGALALRAQDAAVVAVRQHELREQIPEDVLQWLISRFATLRADVAAHSPEPEGRRRAAELRERRRVLERVHADALSAARREVLAARTERGTDPAAADRVLRRLDLQAVALPR